MKQTKDVPCIGCGVIIQIGKFASAKKAQCDACKGTESTDVPRETKAGDNPAWNLPDAGGGIVEGGPQTTSLHLYCDECQVERQKDCRCQKGEPGMATDMTNAPVLTPPPGFTVPKHTEQTGNIKIVLPPTDDEIIAALEAAESAGPKANSMRASRDAKAQTEVRPFTPEPFFLRQSMISSYLQCPAKFYETYENGYHEETIFTKVGTAIHGIMEDFWDPANTATPEELFDRWWTAHAIPEWDWYRDWRGMVSSYLTRAAKNPPNIIARELEFRVTIAGIPASGTIDRIDRIDEKTIRIVDYKTNFRPWTDTELSESVQMSYYRLAVEELKDVLGDFEDVVLTYEMLRLGYQQHTYRHMEDLDVFKDWLNMIWSKMLAGVDRAPKLNQYCAFCQMRAACPVYLDVIKSDYTPIITDDTHLSEIDKEREHIVLVSKIIDKRKDELDEMIKTLIVKQQGPVAIDDEYEYATTQQTQNTFDVSGVIRTLAIHGKTDILPDVVSIRKTDLDKAVKGNATLEAAIGVHLTTGYKSPSLTRRKIKKEKVKKK